MRSSAAARRRSAAMSRAARTARTRSSPTTAAATGIARSARGGRPGLARRARGRAATRRLLPPRVHAAGSDRRYRLPEQGRHLRSVVQGGGRDHAHHRRRPQASRRQDRHHRRAPHLGLGADPSSARAHDRAGRWHLASTARTGYRAVRGSFCQCGFSHACSAGCSWAN